VIPVLLDTGVIVAVLDRSERHHSRCVDAIEAIESPLATCEAVIAESCYLLRGLPGAAQAILENVSRGVFQIPLRLAVSASPIQRIMRKYSGIGIDFADACLIQLAEELGSGGILTLDRDFDIYRWGKNRPFRLLIPLS